MRLSSKYRPMSCSSSARNAASLAGSERLEPLDELRDGAHVRLEKHALVLRAQDLEVHDVAVEEQIGDASPSRSRTMLGSPHWCGGDVPGGGGGA